MTGPVDEQPGPSRHRTRHPLRWVAGALLLLLVLAGGYLGYQALHVRSELTAAQSELTAARSSLGAGDLAAAGASVDSAAVQAGRAHERTDGIFWRAAAHVPYLGRPLGSVGQLAAVADDLVDQVVAPVVAAGDGLDLGSLRAADGTVDLAALRRSQPAVHAAAEAVGPLQQRAEAVPTTGFVPQVDTARDQLVRQVAELAPLLDTADRALTLVPSMLGAERPHRYFVGFQTNAEARGTGGLVGAFGILTATDGRLALTQVGSNDDLVSGAAPGVDLGAEFAARYDTFGARQNWYNSNLTAHFPYAAQIWASLWQQQTGEQLDGAVAVDPVALGYLLAATGPVTLPDGEVVAGDNVVALTESQAYRRFADDNDARLAFQQTVATAVAAKVFSAGGGSLPALVPQLARAVDEGRIAVWSADAAEQSLLDGTSIAHQVSTTAGPFAGLVVNNAAGNKMDYYLQRSLEYTAADCVPGGGARASTVTITLTNTAAPGEVTTPYAGGIRGVAEDGVALGTDRSLVSLYATAGAQLVATTVDGADATTKTDAERGHPVFTLQVEVPPGQTRTITMTMTEPSAPGAALVPVQPLVLPVRVTTDVPDCTP